jgi:signal transduction histidine kinase
LSLLLVVGIGLLFLVAFVYALWATAWLEYERVEGLYRYGLPALRPRRRERPGFGGWLRTLWQQAVDGAMWRGIGSAAIATILGLVVLPLVSALATSLVLPFAPLIERDRAAWRLPIIGVPVRVEWAVLIGILGIIVSVALLIGIALLHAVLTRAILVPSREAALAEQAHRGNAAQSAVRAGEVERVRIERDLHDGVQPARVGRDDPRPRAAEDRRRPRRGKALIDEAHTSTKAAITELRQLARGIHASVLDDRGLDAALSALASRSHVPVQLDAARPPLQPHRRSGGVLRGRRI